MDPNELSFINVGHCTGPADWSHAPHSHPFHQILVILQGEVAIRTGERQFTVGIGDAAFYPEGTAHEERSTGKWPVEYVYMSWKHGYDTLPLSFHDDQGRIRTLALWLDQEDKQSTYPGAQGLIKTYVAAILEECRKSSVHRENATVSTVRTFIRDHLSRSITLETLAAAVHLNKYTFLRLYKTLTGVTPMDDLRRIRLETARELIISSARPLQEIAELIGMSDAYQLSRSFKKYYAVPPGYFRQSFDHARKTQAP